MKVERIDTGNGYVNKLQIGATTKRSNSFFEKGVKEIMKYLIIVPLFFFGVLVHAHNKDLINRIYPPIENVDTININCKIIKKYKPQKQIIEMLAFVEDFQDTIEIVASKKDGKFLKSGERYALSVVKVRKFSIAIIRNGLLWQVFFDRDTKNNTYIAYINKVEPPLYILLNNNGIITLKEQNPVYSKFYDSQARWYDPALVGTTTMPPGISHFLLKNGTEITCELFASQGF